MSFSQDVKNEILRHRISKPCCSVAAAYAVACFGKYFDDRGIVLQTENEGVAAFAQKLYRRCGIRGDVLRKERPTGPVFEFSVKDVVEVERLLELFGHTGKEPTLRIRPENFKCQHCVQSFIAAAFLCCGTMTDPEKSYNLEFLSTRHYLSQQLEAMLAEHDFNPHRALRKGANTVYIKSADHLEDLLTFMGAGNAAMHFRLQKVEKDFRNNINRKVNCETANLGKTVEAAARQCQAIRVLEQAGQLEALPEPLRRTAQVRMEHPEESLSELLRYFDPPLSKPGLNNRLRKLEQLAGQWQQAQGPSAL